jgi:hypothetical protein
LKKEPTINCLGSCHCGRVRIAVDVPLNLTISRCNCSICKKSGHLHLTVSQAEFQLLGGEEDLTEYRFNTGTAKHLFCRFCGVKVFYVPRSHPDGFSVNLNCVELDQQISVVIRDFDGRNWEENIESLLTGNSE